MNVFDYFFSCFHYIINVLDHDFFGFGFSYLDFILAASLIFIILRFLLQGFNETDKFNFFSFSGLVRDYGRDYQMSHKNREHQVVTHYVNHDLDSNSITNIRQSRFYDKDNNLVGVINEKTKS